MQAEERERGEAAAAAAASLARPWHAQRMFTPRTTEGDRRPTRGKCAVGSGTTSSDSRPQCMAMTALPLKHAADLEFLFYFVTACESASADGKYGGFTLHCNILPMFVL